MKTITVTPIVKNYNNIVCAENQDIEIEFEALQEDISPSDQFDDDQYLGEFQRTIEEDSELQYCGVSHNWFCAKATVRFGHFEATDYLGACSYASYDEFVKEENGYFSDMVNQCVEEINSEILNINSNIQNRWNARRQMMQDGVYSYFLKNRSTILTY